MRIVTNHEKGTGWAWLPVLAAVACLSLSGLPAPDASAGDGGRLVDNIDYPFVDDPAVTGKWQSVDLVATADQFTPGRQRWRGKLFLKGLELSPHGRMQGPRRWTKGLILNQRERTASRYEIKDMDGATYMFFEWKSGDYTIRHMKPWYYVLRKQGSSRAIASSAVTSSAPVTASDTTGGNIAGNKRMQYPTASSGRQQAVHPGPVSRSGRLPRDIRRSIWQNYQAGMAARRRGDAQAATKAYQVIAETATESGLENMYRIQSLMYLAEIALVLQKDKPQAMERLQTAIKEIDKLDTRTMEPTDAGFFRLWKDYADFEYTKLRTGRPPSPALTRGSGLLSDSLFMLAMIQIQFWGVADRANGMEQLKQYANSNKSPIDHALANLILIFDADHHQQFSEMEKYVSQLKRSDSYFALYVPAMEEQVKRGKQQKKAIHAAWVARIPALVKQLSDPDFDKASSAMFALINEGAGIEGMEALTKAQKSPDKSVRCRAAVALGYVWYDSPYKPDFHVLYEAITGPDKRLATEALAVFCRDNRPAMGKQELSALVMLVKDRDGQIERALELILQKAGPQKTQAAIPAILEILRQEESGKKLWALRVLREMGPAAQSAFSEVAKYLNDSDPSVCENAVQTLKKIDEGQTMRLLNSDKKCKTP